MSHLEPRRSSLRVILFGLVALTGAAWVFDSGLFAQRNDPLLDRRQRTLNDFPNGFHQLARQALPSIISLEARGWGRTGATCRNPGTMHSRGTGFVMGPGDVILTNSRLVTGADRVRIRSRDGFDYWASSAAIDPLTGLAILRMAPPFSLPALPLADSDATQIGDWVLAVGNPGIRNLTSDLNVSAGIVSGRGLLPDSPGNTDFLETDAMISPTNDGGPLLNLNGQVVGINTVPEEFQPGGAGFALPSNQINWVLRELIDHGTVRRSFLGLKTQPLTGPLAKQFHVPAGKGALVTQVLPDSPAAAAKVLPGDVVVALDKQEILSPIQLHTRGERLQAGKTYTLDVLRGGNRSTLNVVPTALVYPPKFAPRTIKFEPVTAAGAQPANIADLGISTASVSADNSRKWGFPAATQGVIIDSVKPGSLAAEAGLRSGMLLDQVGKRTIMTPADLNQIQPELTSKQGVLLRVRTPKDSRFVILGNVP